MPIFNVSIPDRPLTNIDLSTYAREQEIPHFKGVFMRDTLPLNLINLAVTGYFIRETEVIDFISIHMDRYLQWKFNGI